MPILIIMMMMTKQIATMREDKPATDDGPSNHQNGTSGAAAVATTPAALASSSLSTTHPSRIARSGIESGTYAENFQTTNQGEIRHQTHVQTERLKKSDRGVCKLFMRMATLWGQAFDLFSNSIDANAQSARASREREEIELAQLLLVLCSNLSPHVFARELLPEELTDLAEHLCEFQYHIQHQLADIYSRRHKAHQLWHVLQCFQVWTGNNASTESHERLNKVGV